MLAGTYWNVYVTLNVTRLEFQGDVAYFTSNTIVAAVGTSQGSHEAFMARMQLTWLGQYPDSAVQELIKMPNSAYLD